MTLRLTSAVLATIRGAAAEAAPNECCGLLLGHGSLIAEARAAVNVAPDPARHFEIDPQALLDAHRLARSGGPQVVGYFHSHPVGSAEPSATDRALAAGDGRVWAIAGRDAITFWRDDEDGFAPLSYITLDR